MMKDRGKGEKQFPVEGMVDFRGVVSEKGVAVLQGLASCIETAYRIRASPVYALEQGAHSDIALKAYIGGIASMRDIDHAEVKHFTITDENEEEKHIIPFFQLKEQPGKYLCKGYFMYYQSSDTNAISHIPVALSLAMSHYTNIVVNDDFLEVYEEGEEGYPTRFQAACLKYMLRRTLNLRFFNKYSGKTHVQTISQSGNDVHIYSSFLSEYFSLKNIIFPIEQYEGHREVFDILFNPCEFFLFTLNDAETFFRLNKYRNNGSIYVDSGCLIIPTGEKAEKIVLEFNDASIFKRNSYVIDPKLIRMTCFANFIGYLLSVSEVKTYACGEFLKLRRKYREIQRRIMRISAGQGNAERGD